MIIIIQGQLPHYRRAFYNELSKYDDILVIHSGKTNSADSYRFKEKTLPVKKFGPFYLQKGLIEAINAEKPDTVIGMFDIRWIETIIAMFLFDKKLTWIWWGLDEGNSKLALKIKCILARRKNAIVFYNDIVKNFFIKLGIDPNKLFVANNTFHVNSSIPCFEHPKKNKFINVGSLDDRKRNDVTIKCFKKLLLETGLNISLVLIGEGNDRDQLETLIYDEDLNDNVILAGEITNPNELAAYYKEAIASVSFGQAGLAVLQSMAFGVPFVTKESAISGGEKFNIIHEVNGIFCQDSPESLLDVLHKLVEGPDFLYARKLGANAYQYYNNQASVVNMVNGFIKAIKFSENQNV